LEPSSGALGEARDGKGLTLGFVVAEFHQEITEEMLRRALDRCKASGAKVGPILRVGGAYDVCLPVEWLLEHDAVDGVVVIGCIIQGQTKHDEVIAHATAASLQALGLEYDKPIGFAITGPGMTPDQAEARVDAGARGVDAVIRVVEAWRELND
jgi:6,7-dimethyl-8-ribityllumazine synthase